MPLLVPDRSIVRMAVLASGRGSNLEAILRAQLAGQLARARVVAVVSNVAWAPALQIPHALNLGDVIISRAIVPREFASHLAYEGAILEFLRAQDINLVVLAGYMKIVGPALLDTFHERIINIHPSLLPAFPGLHAQRQAIEYGVRFSGCTTHFVDAGVDSGPIIDQRVVPVEHGDNMETLAARILIEEHRILPKTIQLLTEKDWELRGRQFRVLSR